MPRIKTTLKNVLISRKFIVQTFLITLIPIGIILFFAVLFSNRIYPRITVAGISVGGKTYNEAYTLISNKLKEAESKQIVIEDDGLQIALASNDIGLTYDVEKTVRSVFGFGRTKNWLNDIPTIIKTLAVGERIAPKIDYNESKLDSFVEEISNSKDQPAVDSTIKLNKGKLQISPSKTGLVIDQGELKKDLISTFTTLNTKSVSLKKVTATPIVTEEASQEALKTTQSLLTAPIILSGAGQSWKIDFKRQFDFLSFTTNQEEPTPLVNVEGKSLSFQIRSVEAESKPDARRLIVTFNSTKVGKFLNVIAKDVDQEAVNARFEFSGSRVVSFVPHQIGRKLDKNASLLALQKAINVGTKKINLPIKTAEPEITTEKVNNLGLKELLGRGESKFAGSIANRIHNINLGSSRLHGVLIAPGEVFSMYKAVGDVENSTGYREAYIIQNGRTIIGVGGGMCQVSTTLFRTALKAGLPIIERHPHAYRVGYYEQNSAAGLDASVYFPSADLKFKNDTGHYLLIQREINLSKSTLAFEIYGTDDGRVVKMTNPSVTNITPPPKALYQKDSTLAKGVVKQVDFAAWGADAFFKRTVTRDGKILYNDTFYTHYQPWRAVYLVGTKVG